MLNRASAFFKYGDPTVLEILERPEPHPGAGQIRVQMRAAGIQPFDCAFRRGDLSGFLPATFPQVLGNDFAGIVDEVGKGVNGFVPRDEVLGFCTLNAHAELVVVDAAHVVHRPATLPWNEARRTVRIRPDSIERPARP